MVKIVSQITSEQSGAGQFSPEESKQSNSAQSGLEKEFIKHLEELQVRLQQIKTEREEDRADDFIPRILNHLERLQSLEWLRKLISKVVLVTRDLSWLRTALIGFGFAFLLAVMLYSVWDMLPRYYSLRLSGGSILSNRHQLASVLAKESEKKGLYLELRPITGTLAILEAVNQGEVDVALIQGGLDIELANVRHVSAVLPEIMHLLVKPEIKELADLKGKVINMGSKAGGTRVVGAQVLAFSDLESGLDYAEKNYSDEELLTLPNHKLPDAIMLISSVPSFFAEEFIESRHYRLLEIPFPHSLALRYGWVADAQIMPYTYDTTPPVPDRTIASLGINMFMVCNVNVKPEAVVKLLDTLYSVGVKTSLRQELNPQNVTLPSGYPLSEGTEIFLERHQPLISVDNLDQIKSVFGFAASFLTIFITGFVYFLHWLRQKQGNLDELLADSPYVIHILADCAVLAQKIKNTGKEKTEVWSQALLLLLELREFIVKNYLNEYTISESALTTTLEQIDNLLAQCQAET